MKDSPRVESRRKSIPPLSMLNRTETARPGRSVALGAHAPFVVSLS
jgi:hypothetical protein